MQVFEQSCRRRGTTHQFIYLSTCGSGPLHMHSSYKSNFIIRISIKIIGIDVNFLKIGLITAIEMHYHKLCIRLIGRYDVNFTSNII